MTETKKCPHCEVVKPAEQGFGSRNKSGYFPGWCKQCRNATGYAKSVKPPRKSSPRFPTDHLQGMLPHERDIYEALLTAVGTRLKTQSQD